MYFQVGVDLKAIVFFFCGLVSCFLCRGCICLREELCTPSCICQNSQWRFPVWKVLCGRISGNPSVWRRGRRAVARNSKHIFVFAIDPLSLTLSLSYILYCIILFISYICLVLIVCHTCVEPRELQIAPQSYLEKFRGVSPEPFTGNSATLFGYT